MADQATLSEIARIERELARLAGELEALKRKVGGAPALGRRQTKAFTSRPPAPVDSQPMPRVAPPPPPESAPVPSTPATSETVPTTTGTQRRRAAAGSVGLSDFPPATQAATPSRRNAAGDPTAGRYEYVGDGRSPARKSR